MPRHLRLIPALILLACVTGCAPSSAASQTTQAATRPAQKAPPNTIIIDNFTFDPPTLTVAAGTTITWINRDDVPHTVTSTTKPRTLSSPTLDTDASYQFKFDTPGTYPYFCTVHPHMTATIIVTNSK